MLEKNRFIFFVGFMGSGKTYIGRKIAAKINFHFYDLDKEIEKLTSLPIIKIFDKYGESYFRELESRILLKWNKQGVIATGGGIIGIKENRNFLNNSKVTVVWLDPSWKTIFSRITKSDRPLIKLFSEEQLYELWEKRRKFYLECANIVYQKNDLNELISLLY
ncbi:MAG: shikimate kinase [Bacteroidetes bacterium]|nr:MAG: shikimate kinase [Bacteroidota bacterium]